MKNDLFQYQELSLKCIRGDNNQPRKDFGTDGDNNRLRKSIAKHSLLQPIEVCQSDGEYIIIDGHRRFKIAEELGFTTISAIIFPKLKPAEIEIRRFELQNNRRPWKPLERSNALERIKALKHYKTNQQLAELFGVSKTLISNSLQLRTIAFDHLNQMANYGLTESYQIEFIRLKPKIRRIGKYDIQQIIDHIFQKVSDNVIKNAKDFRTLGKVFSRASANESALLAFLSDPDMTVDELLQRSSRSNIALFTELLIKYARGNMQKGIEFSSQEKEGFKELTKLINEVV